MLEPFWNISTVARFSAVPLIFTFFVDVGDSKESSTGGSIMVSTMKETVFVSNFFATSKANTRTVCSLSEKPAVGV